MSRLAWIAVLAALAAGGRDAPEPVVVSVTAIQATRENRAEPYFDPGLEDIRSAVGDLDYDTYRKVKRARLNAPFDAETALDINDTYALRIMPLSREESGQVRLNVRVEATPRTGGRKPINALSTTVAISPEKKLKLRGLKLEPGELVIILSLKE